MARPRSTSDDDLLDAAEQALADNGMRGFTLQAVADRAGVSAPLLVQRFGSKRALLVAVNHRWVATIDDDADAALAGVTDPLDRVRTIALAWCAEMDDPDTVTNAASALGNDLLDDELRGLLAKGWAAQQHRLERELAAAVAAGHLAAAPPPAAAARLLFALAEGIRITWAVVPEGSLVARARADVDAVLDAWG